jgi:glycosyltransferase involved in cell wall biosynthesis
MDKRIKVLLIVDSLGMGGAERQVLEIARRIDRNVFDLYVCSLSIENNLLLEDFQKIDIPVYAIKQYGFFDYSCLSKLFNYIKYLKPDIVHTFLFTADCYGRIAAKLAAVPIIISSQRNVDLWKKSRHILLDRILGRITTRFIANSQAVKRFLVEAEGIKPSIIEVIYNGVDLRAFNDSFDKDYLKNSLGFPANKRIITMVARLAYAKDHITYLKAAKIVLSELKDVYFLIIGVGELEEKIKKEILNFGLECSCGLLGRRRDIPQILSITDISVLTSLYEGCANIILESMAASKPVVATDAGGNRELIMDGSTGYIVPIKDEKALADRICYLLKNPDIMKKMGEVARKRVGESFTLEKMITSIDNLYRELTGK